MKVLKGILLAAFAISLFSFQTIAQVKQDVSKIKEAIANADKNFSENFNKGDAKAMADGYTSDAIAFPPNAPQANGREAIQKVFEGFIALGKINVSLHSSKITVLGTTAISHGTYNFELTMKDGTVSKDNGKYLEVWKEQKNGSWLLEYDMWSSNLPLPAPAK